MRINRNRLDTLYSLTRPDTTAELTYFFHPDHLGSASWITDLSGQPVQHLQYKPFGGDYIDQQTPNTDYAERFRFTGKERDAETGYDYFGARYYSSSLGIWLSVDPMSDKYPSLSPYVYCADNPMRIADKEGMELVITGNQTNDAFKILQETTKLNLTIDESGKIAATIKSEKLNRNDKRLLEVINSTNIIVNIEADHDNSKENPLGGMYFGTIYDNETNKAISTNKIDIIELNEIEKQYNAPKGSGIMHEITEGFEAGKISLNRKTNINPAIKTLTKQKQYKYEYDNERGIEVRKTYLMDAYTPLYPRDYKLYLKAHKRATKAPNE